jgi:CO/xanthine dehydrogenase Mo-binding subunit
MTTLNASTSRRRFLKGAGALTLSFSVPLVDVYSQTAPEKPRLVGDLQTNRMLSAWIRIQSADKSVLLMVGKVELGQGILSAMQQVCAEELDVDFSRIRMISGDTALVPNEGTTAGSFSMPNGASAVQQASAEVRAILLG